MGVIIAAIIGLVLGILFVRKYNKIDSALFSSVEGYQPFGSILVYIGAAIGAVAGLFYILAEMDVISSENSKTILAVALFLFTILVCTSVFLTILSMESVGAMVGKSLFLLFSCAFALAVGAVASVVVILILTVYFVLKLFLAAAFDKTPSVGTGSWGASNRNENDVVATDEMGFERELKHTFGDSYRDDRGGNWTRHSDGTFTQKKD